jgi:hypothetical protein
LRYNFSIEACTEVGYWIVPYWCFYIPYQCNSESVKILIVFGSCKQQFVFCLMMLLHGNPIWLVVCPWYYSDTPHHLDGHLDREEIVLKSCVKDFVLTCVFSYEGYVARQLLGTNIHNMPHHSSMNPEYKAVSFPLSHTMTLPQRPLQLGVGKALPLSCWVLGVLVATGRSKWPFPCGMFKFQSLFCLQSYLHLR